MFKIVNDLCKNVVTHDYIELGKDCYNKELYNDSLYYFIKGFKIYNTNKEYNNLIVACIYCCIIYSIKLTDYRYGKYRKNYNVALNYLENIYKIYSDNEIEDINLLLSDFFGEYDESIYKNLDDYFYINYYFFFVCINILNNNINNLYRCKNKLTYINLDIINNIKNIKSIKINYLNFLNTDVKLNIFNLI